MRFTIRSLLVLTAVVAMLCGIFFVFPNPFAALALGVLSWMTPTALVAAIVYSRGYGRAFAIGAMVPASWVLVYAAYILPLTTLSGLNIAAAFDDESVLIFKIVFATEFALIVLSGGIAVAVRRLCVGPKQSGVAQGQIAQPACETVRAHDKAELYEILEGRLKPRVAEPDGALTSTTADPAFGS